MIDSQQASEALAEINEMTRRVRQSRIYNLASLMLIMWGALVFTGYLGSFLLPRYAGYLWAALNLAGVAGSFAISAFGYPRSGVRTFDVRMLIAFLLFFAFGFLCTSVLGTSRRARWARSGRFISCCSTSSPDSGSATPLSRSVFHQRAGAGRYFGRRLVRSLDGLCRRRRADAWRLVDAPELTWPGSTTSSTNRCGCESWRR
jgi:hypothetical protein